MQLKSLHNFFQNGLLGYYPKDEIGAFFHRVCEHHLGFKRIDVSLKSETLITPETFEYFETIISRLLTYEPIQYILGTTSFFGLEFKVDVNVLIPRPETEELVAWILKGADPNNPLKILDIGTGSGCIAVSLAKHLPNAEVYALDVSPAALEMAQYNAQQNDVQLNCIEANVLEWDKHRIVSLMSSCPIRLMFVKVKKNAWHPMCWNTSRIWRCLLKTKVHFVFYKAIVEH